MFGSIKTQGSNLDRISELPHEYRFRHMKTYPKYDYHGEYELLTGTHSTSMPGLNEILELAWIIFGMISWFFGVVGW